MRDMYKTSRKMNDGVFLPTVVGWRGASQDDMDMGETSYDVLDVDGMHPMRFICICLSVAHQAHGTMKVFWRSMRVHQVNIVCYSTQIQGENNITPEWRAKTDLKPHMS